MKYNTRVTIRLTEEEKDDLQRRADEFQLVLAKFLRLKILSPNLPKNTQVVHVDWEKYKQFGETNFQLRKIGININQLAHNANLCIQMGEPMHLQFEKLIEISENIEDTKKILTEIRNQLDELIDIKKTSN